jgi:hypothetical protein
MYRAVCSCSLPHLSSLLPRSTRRGPLSRPFRRSPDRRRHHNCYDDVIEDASTSSSPLFTASECHCGRCKPRVGTKSCPRHCGKGLTHRIARIGCHSSRVERDRSCLNRGQRPQRSRRRHSRAAAWPPNLISHEQSSLGTNVRPTSVKDSIMASKGKERAMEESTTLQSGSSGGAIKARLPIAELPADSCVSTGEPPECKPTNSGPFLFRPTRTPLRPPSPSYLISPAKADSQPSQTRTLPSLSRHSNRQAQPRVLARQGKGTRADGLHAEHLLIVGVNHGQHVLCDVDRCVSHRRLCPDCPHLTDCSLSVAQ